jgi:photosystem II stability/assembly factor-like uncharacterized protein
MKALYIVLLIIILPFNLFAQWEWIYPWPCGSKVISQSSYQSNVWIISENGDILKSSDYGMNWLYQNGKDIHNMRKIFFLNATVGWIGNIQGTILRTIDGGNHWEINPFVIPYEIIDIFFKDQLNGWASTYSGVFKSTDGGITWEFESNLPGVPFFSIQFIDTTNGYVAGWNGNIYKTLNGGQSWINISTSSNFRIEQIFFTSVDTGWICGAKINLNLDQAIYKTTNGGNTWSVQLYHANQSDGLINSISMMNELGFASSSEGQIYKTVNGGSNWDIVYQSDPDLWSYYLNITFLNSQIIFTTGGTVEAMISPRILISLDQGLNWSSLQKEFELDVMTGSYFFNQNEGLLSGYGYSTPFLSAIYKTYDGGNTWLPKVTSNHFIDDIFFINNLLGWAAGQSIILKTTDSGETWQDFSGGITGYIRSIFFINEDFGWVVGDYNTNFKTTDGGNTWSAMSSGNNFEPKKVFFTDGQHGWIVGVYGYLVKTLDGGQNWTQIQNMPLINYNDVYFKDMNNGLMVADVGNIFITSDGANTWQTVSSGTSFDIDALFYLNENNIWAAGYSGIILQSTEGGQGWEFASSPNFRDLTSIFFLNDSLGWAFGNNGTIIKTFNGGGIIPVELISLTAEKMNNEISLSWSTATETNNKGFEILRTAQNRNDWQVLGFANGHGTTTEMQHYSFTDKNLSPGKYKYRLKQFDYDGSFEYSKIVQVEIGIPNIYSLNQNYPNPFNPITTIKYELPEEAFVTLIIYDVLGREVATLVNEEKPAGNYEVVFPSAVGGRQLASGIYYYQLRAGDFVETKKMVLVNPCGVYA